MATAECSIREILFANKRRYDPQQTIMLGPDFITGNDGCCDLRCIVPESGTFKGRQVIQVWMLKLSVSSSMTSTLRWGLDRRAENRVVGMVRRPHVSQLPSPCTSLKRKHSAFCLLIESGFHTGELHRTSSRPRWAYKVNRIFASPTILKSKQCGTIQRSSALAFSNIQKRLGKSC